MKRAVIVHCWEGYPTYCWYQSTKAELEKLGYVVEVPAFPDTDSPELTKWLPHLQSVVGTPDSDLVLIGHSVGCITIMRFLESLPAGAPIKGVVMVAGFTDDLGFEQLQNFFTTQVDFAKIKSAARQFVAIHSDNDPFVPLLHGEILKEKLGATLVVKHAMKHFSGHVDDEAACTSLSEVAVAVGTM